MKLVITQALRDEVAAHIAAHLVVKANQKGTSEYLTLDPEAQTVDNIGGFSFRVNFATMGMKPATEASKNRVERATANIARLTPEELLAVQAVAAARLEELTK